MAFMLGMGMFREDGRVSRGMGVFPGSGLFLACSWISPRFSVPELSLPYLENRKVIPCPHGGVDRWEC